MTTFQTSPTLEMKCEHTAKSALIFYYTFTASSALLTSFDDAKAKRGGKRGATTDQEQDILRASLVMACAGLDATLKQAIRDCIEPLLHSDPVVREGFEKFIRKRIAGEGDALELASGTKFLAIILADPAPRSRLIEEYIKELTGDSLQSTEEILRTSKALGIDQKHLKLDIQAMREIFAIRNKIIHELDIDLNAKKRKRRVRTQQTLTDAADAILSATRSFVVALDEKLFNLIKCDTAEAD